MRETPIRATVEPVIIGEKSLFKKFVVMNDRPISRSAQREAAPKRAPYLYIWTRQSRTICSSRAHAIVIHLCKTSSCNRNDGERCADNANKSSPKAIRRLLDVKASDLHCRQDTANNQGGRNQVLRHDCVKVRTALSSNNDWRVTLPLVSKCDTVQSTGHIHPCQHGQSMLETKQESQNNSVWCQFHQWLLGNAKTYGIRSFRPKKGAVRRIFLMKRIFGLNREA